MPTEKIEEIVKKGTLPFDAPGTKLRHHDGKCSFETIIKEYRLEDSPFFHCLLSNDEINSIILFK